MTSPREGKQACGFWTIIMTVASSLIGGVFVYMQKVVNSHHEIHHYHGEHDGKRDKNLQKEISMPVKGLPNKSRQPEEVDEHLKRVKNVPKVVDAFVNSKADTKSDAKPEHYGVCEPSSELDKFEQVIFSTTKGKFECT